MDQAATETVPQRSMEQSAYDEEAVRLASRGRRIARVTTILTWFVRIATFLSQLVHYI
jgi:hypothetical protein